MFGLLALLFASYGIYYYSKGSDVVEDKAKPDVPEPPVEPPHVLDKELNTIFAQPDARKRIARDVKVGGLIEEAIVEVKASLKGAWDSGDAHGVGDVALAVYGQSMDVDGKRELTSKGAVVTYTPITDATAPLTAKTADMLNQLAQEFYKHAMAVAPNDKVASELATTLENHKQAIQHAHESKTVVTVDSMPVEMSTGGVDVDVKSALSGGDKPLGLYDSGFDAEVDALFARQDVVKEGIGGAANAGMAKDVYRGGTQSDLITASNEFYGFGTDVEYDGSFFTRVESVLDGASKDFFRVLSDKYRDRAASLDATSAFDVTLGTGPVRTSMDYVSAKAPGVKMTSEEIAGEKAGSGVDPDVAAAERLLGSVSGVPESKVISVGGEVIDLDNHAKVDSRLYGAYDAAGAGSTAYKFDPFTYVD